ncbi:NPH3 domain protein [Raphanus sativus]|nr:NPH3 domain protein [Raphanus sativus]
MKLGSKSDAFQRKGQAWFCTLDFQVILSLKLKLEKCISIFTSFLCSLEVESWKEEFLFFLIKKRKEEIQKHPKKGIGTQLDQAALEDLLMPSFFHTIENIYDVDSVQKILDHFLSTD